ncbi:DUF4435 domain-containing protein [Pseudomonas sp.]|uniref:DUF4435 domain-containing protein n=1 Tax=Pseudomonas sp. TaxID=306 RepID=UPI0028B23518|nr:DUF4435 domain-containing protein [Pseudomonas sp.]
MTTEKARPTPDELYELLKRTSLPTVLVEGKDDIIFYRKVEEELRSFGVDMLPAGNKGAVLELYKKISEKPVSSPIVFVVDNDLWVHGYVDDDEKIDEIITTQGYSIENDLYIDGDLESLLNAEEMTKFRTELDKFTHWYALAVDRRLRGVDSRFRTHPGKILDDEEYYLSEMVLLEGEPYPENFLEVIRSNYSSVLRGKSLFALLVRELSSKRREVKFSVKQLMEFGASRRGENFKRMSENIREVLERAVRSKEAPKL